MNDLNEGEARLNDLNASPNPATCHLPPVTCHQPPVTCHLPSATSTPAVYSIFTGRKPYLDEYLAGQGKLAFIDTLEKVSAIRIAKCNRPATFVPGNPGLTKEVVDVLCSLKR